MTLTRPTALVVWNAILILTNAKNAMTSQTLQSPLDHECRIILSGGECDIVNGSAYLTLKKTTNPTLDPATGSATKQLLNQVDCLDSSLRYQVLPKIHQRSNQKSQLLIHTQLAVFGIYDVSASNMVRISIQLHHLAGQTNALVLCSHVSFHN